MLYTPLFPKTEIHIPAIYSVHYFEYSSSYAFPGESHDFWELLYVDKGEVHVTAGEKKLILKQGEMIFHPPKQFHALSAKGVAPDLVVISFSCDDVQMASFADRISVITAYEKSLLGRIIEESALAFDTPLGDPETKQLGRRDNAAFGSEQLALAALSELLIRLIRRELENTEQIKKVGSESPVISEAISYLERHMGDALSVEQISNDLHLGRSRIQQLFKEYTGSGVIEYFSRMKIKAAQRMIREERLNFAEIAASLGFQSPNYFSRRFHYYTGMSPREYEQSVKKLTGLPEIISDNSASKV